MCCQPQNIANDVVGRPVAVETSAAVLATDVAELQIPTLDTQTEYRCSAWEACCVGGSGRAARATCNGCCSRIYPDP